MNGEKAISAQIISSERPIKAAGNNNSHRTLQKNTPAGVTFSINSNTAMIVEQNATNGRKNRIARFAGRRLIGETEGARRKSLSAAPTAITLLERSVTILLSYNVSSWNSYSRRAV